MRRPARFIPHILAITLGFLVGAGCGDEQLVGQEASCADDLDNDSDGFVDCDDPDCDTSVDCQPPCDHDNICDSDEDAVGCPSDCAVMCGDGRCDATETRVSCPQDCAVCDDGHCDTGEDRVTCPADCAVCDDGHCDTGETRVTCPADCAVCDDGHCDPGETRVTCPADCAVCDDGFCDTGETRVTCPEDCAVCDDGFCDPGEDRVSCPDDCIYCGDGTCDSGELITDCPVDCATVLVQADFSTWLPSQWSTTNWSQYDSGTATWAESTGQVFSQDSLLETPVFSTAGYSKVLVSFKQDYSFGGTGVWTGVYVDTPPDFYTIGQPTDFPTGPVLYDISTEAASKVSVQVEFAIGCNNGSQCFITDYWRITEVLIYAW